MRVAHPKTYICLFKEKPVIIWTKKCISRTHRRKNANMKGQPGRILQTSCLHTHFQKVHSLKLSCKIAHKKYAAAKSLSYPRKSDLSRSGMHFHDSTLLKVCIEMLIFSKCMKNTENIIFCVNILRSLSLSQWPQGRRVKCQRWITKIFFLQKCML